MGLREQFQKIIDRKQDEISRLESEIEKAKTYVQAIQDSMRFLPKESTQNAVEQQLRPTSGLARARDAIKAAGKPLHISDILKAIGHQDDKKHRVSLSGSISNYARKGQIFTRTAPNTFGLLGGENLEISDPDQANGIIPEDFGTMQ